jgi:23S rRNA (guanosine2251-2'-O)-methyltransferase
MKNCVKKDIKSGQVCVLLHNIRSVHNVGSIFRTSDAVGVDKIYISGFTPCPIDKWGRDRKDFTKVSLGSEKSIEWEAVISPIRLIEKLKKLGYRVIALEQSANSSDYKKIRIKKDENVLIVVGYEVEGISGEILNKADVIAEIPMRGQKESLNVSVAFGVAVFRILNR